MGTILKMLGVIPLKHKALFIDLDGLRVSNSDRKGHQYNQHVG